MHPHVQQKAQEEIDSVIGRDRLPELTDRDLLPYTSALVKEVIRWQPIAPLAIPHRLIADDVYNGMDIPKGSIVYPNIWAMSRDMTDYGPDPEVFRPERFLETKARDPVLYVFGFGRRICPGRYMAINSIFISICAVLHVFAMSKSVNEDGSEKTFEPRWEDGITVHLAPFPASFKLRFEGAENLINAEE